MTAWPLYVLLGLIVLLLLDISNKLRDIKKGISDLTGWLKLGLIPPNNEHWGNTSYLPMLKPIVEELRAIKRALEGR